MGSDFRLISAIMMSLNFVGMVYILVLLHDMRSRNLILYRAVLYLIRHLSDAAEWNAKHSARRNMKRILKKFSKEKQGA